MNECRHRVRFDDANDDDVHDDDRRVGGDAREATNATDRAFARRAVVHRFATDDDDDDDDARPMTDDR